MKMLKALPPPLDQKLGGWLSLLGLILSIAQAESKAAVTDKAARKKGIRRIKIDARTSARESKPALGCYYAITSGANSSRRLRYRSARMIARNFVRSSSIEPLKIVYL